MQKIDKHKMIHWLESEFVDNPLSSFIEDLRHYCVHRSPIDIITYHNFGNDKITNTSYIKKDSLVQWKSISSGSKIYLTNYEKDIRVMEPITAYKDKVVEFRKWLITKKKYTNRNGMFKPSIVLKRVSM